MRTPSSLVLRRIAVAAWLYASVLLAVPTPAAAECGRYDPWPSFRDVAPSAKTVVSGEVVTAHRSDSADRAIIFDVRVDEVYRGDAPAVLRVDALRTGLPAYYCDQSYLRTYVGNVIALALDGRVDGFDGPVNTVAWLEGRPDRFSTPEVERVTEDEIRSLLELPPSDTVASPAPATQLPFILAGPAVLGVMLWQLRRRRIATDHGGPR